MAGKFQLKKFSDLDLSDPFFDSLKADYPGNAHSTGFADWFAKKSAESATALVFNDDEGVGAFVYLKSENEAIELDDKTLSATPRIKIGTFRLAERYRGQRLGEGALGLALWHWQKTALSDIYVTVFKKHQLLIAIFERFGFLLAGHNPNGERVYIKSRRSVDYSDPYKAFPFINPEFTNAGYLVVDDVYHDTLFPYSELHNTIQEQVAISAANGLSKVYIGSPRNPLPYLPGEPILIYRKYTGTEGKPGFKSCITSYCVVTNVIVARSNYRNHMSITELLERIGNKSVFDEGEIRDKYSSERDLTIVEMLYYGFFGSGNNVNWMWLRANRLWPDGYPTTARLSQADFKTILAKGEVNVANVIVN